MHYPTFRGKFNSLKARVWLFLADVRERDPKQHYTSVEIAEILNVNTQSLQASLTRWSSPDWKRVLRRKRGNQDLFEYRLSAKGMAWIEDYRMMIPVQRYQVEDKAKLLLRERLTRRNTKTQSIEKN